MSLDIHPLELTGSDQVIFTVPEGIDCVANNVLFTGSGNLTLKVKKGVTGQTHTMFSSKSITDEIALQRPLNLSSGDQLIASGAGLTAFISVYYVGADAGSAALPYGPGPQEPIAGDHNNGYFGVVPAEAFYSGNRLALELGVTEGVLQNSDAGWLKFARKGEVVFIAKQAFMHSVTYDHLYSRGLVYGVDGVGASPRGTPTNQWVTVEHGGNRFSVSLMTGANADPFPESDALFFTDDMVDMDIGAGSDWSTLMYRVHADMPTGDGTDGMRADTHGGPQAGDNWATFSNSELNIGSGSGRRTWCQEHSDDVERFRATRGADDVAYFGRTFADYVGSTLGWRPRLVLIPHS